MTAKKATLEEIGEMLTHVLKHMATKEDIARLEIRADKVEAQLTSIEAELRSLHRDVDDLRERYENVMGFRKEIDHALERITAIEKHLGIEKKVAA